MVTAVDLDDCYKFALKIASEAGEIIRTAISQKKNVQTKLSNVDLVTETDRKVEEFLKKELNTHYPEHHFIGEETTTALKFTYAPTWIVDPVDGTMNFVHGFPYTAVSIGLTVGKEVVLGVVYNPILNKMYSAMKGRGAFCNDMKIEVSSTKDLSEALIIAELGSNRTPAVMQQVYDNFKNLSKKVHGIRMMGSAALNMCAVASGEADGYFEYCLHCWDMAGAKIIVEEAGGVVIDPEGGPHDLMSRRVVCASCPEIAQALSKELVHIQLERD